MKQNLPDRISSLENMSHTRRNIFILLGVLALPTSLVLVFVAFYRDPAVTMRYLFNGQWEVLGIENPE